MGFGRSIKDYVDVTLDVLLQKWFCRSVPRIDRIGDTSVEGYNVLVTGCTSGIGKAAATEFAKRQCNLYLACRNKTRGDALKAELEKKYYPEQDQSSSKVHVLILDLSDLDSVVSFGKHFNSLHIPLHILVNNAGVFAMSAPRSVCFANYELHLLTNYLAGALATLLLLPALHKASQCTHEVS